MTQASFAQHGMWITQSHGPAYHMPLLIDFHDDLDVERLARACSAVAERHPVLLSTLHQDDGVTHLVPAGSAPALRIADPRESVADEIARSFDLSQGPLIRFTLFRPRTLAVTAHHLVFDGHSKDLLLRDLAARYNGADPGEPPPTTFGHHADAERARVGAALAEAREFWQHRWSEPAPVMVSGAILSSRAAGPGQVLELALRRPDLDGLTAFETTLAALHALLFLYGNSRVTTAVDLSTRTPETAGVIGPFVNELPLSSRPSGERTFREFALAIRAECREVYRFREVPLARAVSGVRPYAALAPISVSYRRRQPYPVFVGSRAEVDWLAFNGAVRGELQVQLVDDGAELTASLRFSPRAAGVAPGFAEHLRTILERVGERPDAPLHDLLEVDSAAVPQSAPAPARPVVSAAEAELVEQVRQIWQEVMEIDPIEVDDDIFDLGGHSLTITQIIARMHKRLGVEVPLDVFFDNPTIAGVLDAVHGR